MFCNNSTVEEKKIIKGYSALLDHGLLGYDITAVIEIKTTQGKMLEIENIIAKQDNVIAVYDITGPLRKSDFS